MSKWQHNSSWQECFEITGADGVAFHSIGCHPEKADPILPGESYTKEEFFKAKTYPRSGYTFWKMINGEKYYISLAQPPEKTHEITINVNLDCVKGHLHCGQGTIKLTDNEFKELEQNPYHFISKYNILNKLNFIVDNYGPMESVNWKEIK